MTNKRAQSKSFEHKGVTYKSRAESPGLLRPNLTSCQLSQTVYKQLHHSTWLSAVGDNVLLLNQADVDAPFICRIENIVGKGRDAAMRVKWYYRPEETCSGRRAFHSEHEVMASDHVETHLQPAASIVSKCRIHTLEKYMELEKKTSKDLYSRFTYLAGSQTFQPDQIAVYCKCQMPFNPDKHMIECPNCQSWFHPECLGYRRDEFRRKFYSGPNTHFLCADCEAASPPVPEGDEEDHETSETIAF